MESYQPPFKITSKIIDYISRISEKIGEINGKTDGTDRERRPGG